MANTPEQPALTPEDVATYPLPGMAIPGDFAFSPDDRLITSLCSPDESLTRQLYALDSASGEQRLLVAPSDGGTTEERVSLEEALRRERQRQRALGVTQYAWARHANRLLVPLHGALFVQDGDGAPLREILPSGAHPALDPQLSPDGAWVAYVRDAELSVLSAHGGEPRQLTDGARGTGRTHGLAEFIAQEEMGRSHGFWWSPDSQQIAFTAVDETHIPIYRIIHQGKDATGDGAQEDHRYPFAGMPNATVRLGVIPVAGGGPVWMDLGMEQDQYLARVNWFPDGTLTAQIENRAQTVLDLVRFDPQTGAQTRLLRETSDVWINLHNLLRPLDGGGFIWASERTGFQHLYRYDRDGNLLNAITSGDWMVDGIAGVDEASGLVYFTGTLDGPTERHLYVATLDGGEPRRITAEAGMHAVVINHALRRFVDVHHNIETPPTVTLRALADGSTIRTLYDKTDPRIARLALPPPALVTLHSRDGEILHGTIYRPPARFGAGPFPTIVSVYGGPGPQRVQNSWGMTVDLRAQYLRENGFLVFVLDNRGSARRGLAFESRIKHNMGHIEVEDQVDGVRWLVAQGLADPARVGIYGWSYGGYMAAMSLARAPETFTVAVAGAPVTHFDGYDTHYTERYMSTPQSNPQGYTDSSVMHHVGAMTGKLLLVHGLIDENVHFRHTARLINALIRARKSYDLLLFPDERHMPRKIEDRVFMEEQIRDYFVRNL
ncbi:MAG: S9 family peptidase, partial [Chloroflexota bacterium]|nr:S9 family peptidase [Chloroflexota bacterium]